MLKNQDPLVLAPNSFFGNDDSGIDGFSIFKTLGSGSEAGTSVKS
jgi:hypothetical protein